MSSGPPRMSSRYRSRSARPRHRLVMSCLRTQRDHPVCSQRFGGSTAQNADKAVHGAATYALELATKVGWDHPSIALKRIHQCFRFAFVSDPRGRAVPASSLRLIFRLRRPCYDNRSDSHPCTPVLGLPRTLPGEVTRPPSELASRHPGI